jgi:hypothetical protein
MITGLDRLDLSLGKMQGHLLGMTAGLVSGDEKLLIGRPGESV